MRLNLLFQGIVVVAVLGQGASEAAALPEPIATRLSEFAIPFRLEPGGDPSRQPVELQLYVSTDRGAHWQYHAKAHPAQKAFLFRPGADGEYWFAIRTIDRTGAARPERIAGPALRVMVDRKPPSLQHAADAAGSRAVAKAQVQTSPAQAGSSPEATISATPEPKGSVAIAISPAIGNKFGEADEKSPIRKQLTAGLPPGESPRMINSRLFDLEYDVDSVGPSGIGRVELWGTRDGGRTWRQFTVDSDHRSPLRVSVDEEGVYGFRVVVTNGAGLGGRPPESGDLPDLWVGVDLTKPLARIISAEQGVGAEAGHIIISWQADDKSLAARPVSLSFAESPTGPWLPIAAGLENTGRYAWLIDRRTPQRLYLRLEVQDEAGNAAVSDSPEAVAIDQSRPTIRVREVRPVGEMGARPDERR